MTVDKKRYTLLKGSSLQIRQQYHCRHRSDCFILFFKLCTLTRVDLDFFFLITEATSAVPHSFTFFPSNICFWKHFQGQICGFSTQTNTFLGQRRRKKKPYKKQPGETASLKETKSGQSHCLPLSLKLKCFTCQIAQYVLHGKEKWLSTQKIKSWLRQISLSEVLSYLHALSWTVSGRISALYLMHKPTPNSWKDGMI